MHTPTGPRSRWPPAASTECPAAGGGAREPQKQAFTASVEEPDLEHGEAKSDMPPKKKQRRDAEAQIVVTASGYELTGAFRTTIYGRAQRGSSR